MYLLLLTENPVQEGASTPYIEKIQKASMILQQHRMFLPLSQRVIVHISLRFFDSTSASVPTYIKPIMLERPFLFLPYSSYFCIPLQMEYPVPPIRTLIAFRHSPLLCISLAAFQHLCWPEQHIRGLNLTATR